jgi:hypothetical protein
VCLVGLKGGLMVRSRWRGRCDEGRIACTWRIERRIHRTRRRHWHTLNRRSTTSTVSSGTSVAATRNCESPASQMQRSAMFGLRTAALTGMTAPEGAVAMGFVGVLDGPAGTLYPTTSSFRSKDDVD